MTYRNLRTRIWGFFAYADMAFAARIAHVPMLHSNSSVFEALFLQIHGLHHDMAAKYISCAINSLHSLIAMEKNKMYPLEGLSNRKDTSWKATFESWKAGTGTDTSGTADIDRFRTNFVPRNQQSSLLLDLLKF